MKKLIYKISILVVSFLFLIILVFLSLPEKWKACVYSYAIATGNGYNVIGKKFHVDDENGGYIIFFESFRPILGGNFVVVLEKKTLKIRSIEKGK